MASREEQQPLLGETLVTATNAFEVADACQRQALEIMASSSGWAPHHLKASITGDGLPRQSSIIIERKAVSGPFSTSGILLTRAESPVLIPASADAVFATLVSPSGYVIIDPSSDPAEFEGPPLERYHGWIPLSSPPLLLQQQQQEQQQANPTSAAARLEMANAFI